MSNIERHNNLGQILVGIQPKFEKLASIHKAVHYRREASFALEILQGNDYLASVAMSNQTSFERAIINVAAIGLTLNPAHGLAYLIPRKKKVILDISYKGKIALAVEIGSIKWCMAELVYEKDIFKPKGAGLRPIHDYDPFLDDRGRVRGGYAIAKTNSNELIITYMSIKEIYLIRQRSEAWLSGKQNPWKTDENEMIKKTLIRRNSKLWPFTSTHNRERLDEVEKIESENDPIPELAPLDLEKRSGQIELIKDHLLRLNIDQDYYLLEKLPQIVRRKIESFTDLTDIEIDQIMVQLTQLNEEKNAES